LNWAGWTLVGCQGLGLIVNVVEHGNSKPNYNGITQFLDFCIMMVLFHYAGLF